MADKQIEVYTSTAIAIEMVRATLAVLAQELDVDSFVWLQHAATNFGRSGPDDKDIRCVEIGAAVRTFSAQGPPFANFRARCVLSSEPPETVRLLIDKTITWAVGYIDLHCSLTWDDSEHMSKHEAFSSSIGAFCYFSPRELRVERVPEGQSVPKRIQSVMARYFPPKK